MTREASEFQNQESPIFEFSFESNLHRIYKNGFVQIEPSRLPRKARVIINRINISGRGVIVRQTPFEAKLRQENARLRILLRAVKRSVPIDLRERIEAELQDENPVSSQHQTSEGK